MKDGINIDINELMTLFMVATGGMMLYRQLDPNAVDPDTAIKVCYFILNTSAPGQTWSLADLGVEGISPKLLIADNRSGETVEQRITTEDASEEHLQCFIDVANTVWGGVVPEPSTPLVQDLRV